MRRITSARLVEQTGADALELNVYYVPTDQRLAGARIEETMLELVRQVRQSVSIPLAVKLSPFYSSVAHVAHALGDMGVDGLVLFNRFNQPDIDLETLEVVTKPLISSEGEGEAVRLPLRWIAIESGPRVGRLLFPEPALRQRSHHSAPLRLVTNSCPRRSMCVQTRIPNHRRLDGHESDQRSANADPRGGSNYIK